MDVLFKPVGHLKRAIPSPLRPLFLCDTPHKKDYVSSRFAHCFFGIVYQGSGSFEVNDKTFRIDSPSVITQWPGPYFNYGPDSEWSEIYTRFDISCFNELQKWGLWSPDRPCYPIEDFDGWSPIHSMVREQLSQTNESFDVNILDRLVELLILKTLPENRDNIPSELPGGTRHQIRRLQKEIQNDLSKDYNWSELATNLSMSESTFRRHWLSLCGVPPARYLSNLRLERGSGLLLATSHSVKEIAYAVGFEDPLHFSRKFKQYYRVSPRAYRAKNRR